MVSKVESPKKAPPAWRAAQSKAKPRAARSASPENSAGGSSSAAITVTPPWREKSQKQQQYQQKDTVVSISHMDVQTGQPPRLSKEEQSTRIVKLQVEQSPQSSQEGEFKQQSEEQHEVFLLKLNAAEKRLQDLREKHKQHLAAAASAASSAAAGTAVAPHEEAMPAVSAPAHLVAAVRVRPRPSQAPSLVSTPVESTRAPLRAASQAWDIAEILRIVATVVERQQP